MTKQIMTKQETIALLKQQMPSFYSLEQVINIVENIKENDFQFDIDKISTDIAESINNENTRIVSDFNVIIDYNKTIDLEDISFNEYKLADIIKNSLDEYLQNTKEETGA
jgi:hypothetical protein